MLDATHLFAIERPIKPTFELLNDLFWSWIYSTYLMNDSALPRHGTIHFVFAVSDPIPDTVYICLRDWWYSHGYTLSFLVKGTTFTGRLAYEVEIRTYLEE